MPGPYTLVLRGVSQVPFVKDPMAKQKGNVPADAFCTPIPVLVIPNAVAKLTPSPLANNNTLKIGTPADLVVKIDRQFDYAGEIKVKFELPKGATGVTAAEVTVPAGKDEAKLTLKADGKPGAIQNATVTATAVYAGKYAITQEAKVSFNVVEEPKKK